jgi:hypothetical protein
MRRGKNFTQLRRSGELGEEVGKLLIARYILQSNDPRL